MNTNKIFLDTNIWLYSVISTDQTKHQKAKTILTNPSNEIYCNSQIVNEICYNLIHKKLLTEEEIQKLIISIYDKYIVTTVSKLVLLDASEIRNQYRVDVWSSIVMAGAKVSECDFIYSDSISVSKAFDVDIINPFE